MSKVMFFILGMLSGVVLPIYALKPVDEANFSKPEIRVIDRYFGEWRGWSDGCIDCEIPDARGSVPDLAYQEDTSISVPIIRKNMNSRNSVQSLPGYRSGYCECNCKKTVCE